MPTTRAMSRITVLNKRLSGAFRQEAGDVGSDEATAPPPYQLYLTQPPPRTERKVESFQQQRKEWKEWNGKEIGIYEPGFKDGGKQTAPS